MEIIVAVSILSILAATLAMRAGGMIGKGKNARVIELASTFRTLCAAYHADVGAFPREYSASNANNRDLSTAQTAAGWSGPYLEAPLTHSQNPYNGQMHLYNSSTIQGLSGFDVDGDGTDDVTGAANVLYLSSVSTESATEIDSRLDPGVPGTWSTTGRVRYNTSNSRLYILVYY
jgi:type II secretory pathway pseudopilin PulG